MNLLRHTVPIFLILFTLGSLYVFFLGKNGLTSHQEKKKRLFDLQESTELLRKKIETVQKKREDLEKMEEFALEKLARSKALKKVGEKLILLRYRDQLKQEAENYEKHWLRKEWIKGQKTDKTEPKNFLNLQNNVFIWIALVFSAFVLIAFLPSWFLHRKQTIEAKPNKR